MKMFRLQLLIRLIIIFAVLAALANVFADPDFLFTQLILFLLVAILLLELFYKINTSNRQLAKFLFALQHNDFSTRFERSSGTFGQLYQNMNGFLEKWQAEKQAILSQKEWQENILQQLPLAILVMDEKGEVVWRNKETAQLFSPAIKELTALEKESPQLYQLLKNKESLKPNRLQLESEVEWQFHCFEIQTEEQFNLWVFSNIQQQLAEAEVDAWMKLIKVLTHEIMNSITTISSLAATTVEMAKKELPASNYTEALVRIEERSKGLLSFVDRYREVSNVPAPQKKWLNLKGLIDDQLQLMSDRLESVVVNNHVDPDLNCYADPQQSEQLLINLLLNAIDAMKHEAQANLRFYARQEKKLLMLTVEDNGKGIAPSDQNMVFVPFFSTREEGSGIGLSLCRQIMRNHGGSIALKQSSKEGTTFELRFPIP